MAFFDVIIPTYNRVSTLARAVESVLGQSFPDLNLLVVDDGSTDATRDLMRRYRDPRLRYLWQPHRGVSRARNHGASSGRSPWIALLDSDDQWLPDKLEMQHRFLQRNPNLRIVHCDELWIRDGNQVMPGRRHRKSGGFIFEPSLELCLISPSAVVLSRSLWQQFGGFREDFPVCEDYDLWLRITSSNEVGFIDRPLVKKHGGHGDQLSRRFKAMDMWRVRSLVDLVTSGDLGRQQTEAATSELRRKIGVLTKGFKKHGNFADWYELSRAVRLCQSLPPDSI